MQVFIRVLLGLGITVMGSYIVIRTRAVLDFFGPIDWAERKLGGGGSAVMYKTIGLIFCFMGLIVAANLWDWFLQATIGSLLPHFGPQV